MSFLGDDITTDAVADQPRPRGTVIPDPPKPRNTDRSGHIPEEGVNKQFPCGQDFPDPGNDTRKGFPKSKIPEFQDVKYNFVLNGCSKIQFGSTIHIGAPTKNQPTEAKNDVRIPPAKYRGLVSSTKRVNDAHLDRVAATIGNSWRKLGLLLHTREADLDRLENDNRDDHHEKVYQLLREWNLGTGGDNQAALLSHLSTVLWQLQETDALDALLVVESDSRLKD